MKKHTLVFTFAAVACLTMAQSAAAQVDPRLERWIGCWRLEDDLAGTGARLCITPEKDGVRMQTIAGTHRGTNEVVIPDGVTRPIDDTECQGTERSEWSRNGQRVFRITEVTCKNETPRTIKGLSFLASGNSLINVQQVSGAGATPNVRVQRYRRAANQNLADGTPVARPRNATAPIDPTWTIDDVIEASGKLPAEALQGALVDVKQKFNVNRRTLVAMDEAGVPDTIIDLMVALTFPDRFVVERVTSSSLSGISTGMGWYDPFMMAPLMSGTYSSCYAPVGYYGYRSYYNMCGPYMYGYNYYPYNNYYYGNSYYQGGWVPIDNNNGGGAVVAASGHGRVVNGQGYTQIRERTPEPSVPRTSSRGDGSAAGWSGASSSGGVSSSGYSSGGSSSSSGASSGSSSGGSSGGGDRVAVPRPGGGH